MDPTFRDLDGRDAYELLGVKDNCARDDIAKAFRARMRDWHPDKHADAAARAEAERVTRLLNVAMFIVRYHRHEYDLYRQTLARREQPRPPQPVDPERPVGPKWVYVVQVLVLLAATLLVVEGRPAVMRVTTGVQVPVPDELAGHWIGAGLYPGTLQQYVVRLSFKSGWAYGFAAYPLHGCGGRLTPQELIDGRLVLTREPAGACTSARMEVRSRDDGALDLRVSDQGGTRATVLHHEPGGLFRLPERMAGTWIGPGLSLTLDNKAPGFAGTATRDGVTCLLVPLRTTADSATLAVGGSNCSIHGTWRLDGALKATFVGADGQATEFGRLSQP